MKLKRNSYVRKIAEYGGLQRDYDVWKNNRTNVCSLFWRVVWGLLRAPATVAVVSGGVSVLIYLFIGFPLFELWGRFWLGLPWDFQTKLVLCVLAACWAFVAYQVYAALSGKRVVEKTLSTVSDVISSRWSDFKNKTCTIVEVE